MTDLFLKIVDMSISATYLVLLVMLLRLVLKRAPKWVNVLLWGLVAFRLLCPFTLESTMSLIPDSLSSGEVLNSWTDDYVGDVDIIHDNQDSFQDAVAAGRTPLYAGEDGYYVVTAPDSVNEPRTVGNSVVPLLSIVWLLGMGAMGEYTFFTYLRLKRRVKLAIKVTEDVYLSEFVDTPFVLGLFRPRIYLPYLMSEQDSHHVIAHERTHIRRKDHWWKPLGFALLTIHWFNPAMWLAYILLCRDIEMACDEKVVQELDTQQRADYSQALLNCSVHHRQITACPLAFGEVGVKERVKNVLGYRKPAFWVVVICIVVVIVAAVCFLTEPVKETNDLTISLTTLADAQIEKVKLVNMHNGTISWILDADEVDSIVAFLQSISGHNGVSSKGYYEGSYSVTLVSVDGEETHIGFGDSPILNYGDFGDGYPVRYELDHLSIAEVKDFFGQYDISNIGISLGVSLDVESVSPTGATVVFRFGTEIPLPDWLLKAGNDYHIQKKVDGSWTNVATLQEATFTTEAYDITNIRRHTINWEWLYGELPPGEYRIGKSISLQKGIGDTESGTVYGEFTIPEPSQWTSPYAITSTLSADNARGSAEFLANGGGYNFFDEMEVQLVEILRALDENAFIASVGIDAPHTIITLTAGDTALELRSDENQVEISIDAPITGTRWVVENTALNNFFAYMNQFSQANSTYEIYNVAPLEELSPYYSIEEASIDKVVVTENGLVMYNSEVWAEFWDKVNHHTPATVRCMEVSEAGRDIFDIEFDGEEYHYRTMRDGELWDISYRYLLFFSGKAPENAEYDAFEYFVLVNDDTVTWEQIQRSYISSQSADQVDHRIVHWHHIYYPKQPRIPEAVQAELVADGQTIALVTDETTVHEIWQLISQAEGLGFEPATYFFGPRLMLLDGDGSAYAVELDVTDDLCGYGGQFYDYGPGMDGDASINNLPRLLALFALEDWPEIVKELYSDLFG